MESIPSENQRFKDWLEHHRRSASSVAKDLGVSRAVLSHILSGRNKLSLSVVQSAARAYSDFDLAYIVLGESSRQATSSPPSAPQAPTNPHTKTTPSSAYDQLILVRDGHFKVLVPE